MEANPGTCPCDPHHRHLIITRGRAEHHRLLPGVERRGNKGGLVLVTRAKDVGFLVLHLEPDVVGGNQEVARGQGPRGTGSLAVNILVLNKDLTSGNDGADSGPSGLPGGEAPLKLEICGLDWLLHHPNLHNNLPLCWVLLRGPEPRNDLHILVQVSGVHIPQRPLAVLEVVVMAALERQRVPDPLFGVVPLLQDLPLPGLIQHLDLVNDPLEALHGDCPAFNALKVRDAPKGQAPVPVPAVDPVPGPAQQRGRERWNLPELLSDRLHYLVRQD